MNRFRWLVAFVSLAFAGAILAADGAPMPDPSVGLRVGLDAEGKVQSLEPAATGGSSELNAAAAEFARKLSFSPARKDGVAAPSEFTLYLTLAMEPRAGGQFALRLVGACNGPGITELAPIRVPDSLPMSQRGGLLLVGTDLQADGRVVADSVKVVKAELSSPSTFVEARYLEAIRAALKKSRFLPETVAGQPVAAHVEMVFQLGGRPSPRDEEDRPLPGQPSAAARIPASSDMPAWHAAAMVPGIDLPQVQFNASLPAK
jgi:hypothetical protein